MYAQRRRAARMARERYMERRRLKREIDQLEREKCRLLNEKITLQDEIDLYKSEIEKSLPQVIEI